MTTWYWFGTRWYSLGTALVLRASLSFSTKNKGKLKISRFPVDGLGTGLVLRWYSHLKENVEKPIESHHFLNSPRLAFIIIKSGEEWDVGVWCDA